ncbi:dibenzothiophene desulfurization enzyme A [Leucosporidium creatinivorum]|uniref:Dibenzothiophene desulfurization enzyme A n=1 Tax=Leucosporidium creatinivorum TaxID=106004 RepID=A0A1Y2FCX7_9BASI|nr:dibenzothiophene desulfurization enzyme A [Leucosporidium creatinivorum]
MQYQDLDDSAPRPTVKSSKKWILQCFQMASPTHHNPGGWKHPTDKSTNYHDISFWTDLAQILERGKFHGVFIADALGPYDVYGEGLAEPTRTGTQWGVDDPVLVLSAMAAVTKNLALGVTQSVTYESPYTVARRFSTLDHLTKGRVGFNVVTSFLDSAARSFGLTEQVPHDERYIRAHEYMEVLYKLWSSWREDAVVLDRERDVYAEPSGIRKINHEGKYFSVEGPSLVEPSPQGTPLLYQAGSSASGVGFGAKHAEVVFMAGRSRARIRTQVDILRSAVEQEGRDPQSVKVLIKALVIVDETDEKAKAKEAEFLAVASREGAKVLIGGWFGINLAQFKPDDDLLLVGPPALQGMIRGTYQKLYPDVTKWTPDVFADTFVLGGMGPRIVGSPTTVADELQLWIEEADIDGFNLAYAVTPGTMEDIVDHLVPELQRRGVHWLDYPSRADGNTKLGITAREGVFGVGQVKLREDHFASKYRWRAGSEAPKLD